MGRLTEGDARRLADVLADAKGQAERERQRGEVAAGNAGQSSGDEKVQLLQNLFSDAVASDELGRALTLDLASYLNRPVRCSVTQATSPVANAWRFEAGAQGVTWWLDLDVQLASAFADALIGGDGTGHVGHGRRIRMLVERIAARFFGAIATAAGVAVPPTAGFAASDTQSGVALAGGLCAVAADQHGWQMGMRIDAPVIERVTLALPRLLEGAAADAQRQDAADAALASPLADDPDAILRAAVLVLKRHLQEVLRCQIDATEPAITRLSGTDLSVLPAASLGLALTARGNGAVVAFLNAQAVASLAAGAVGGPIATADTAGEVVLAAAEAIVRDALGDVARSLPGIASDSHRIVRLSDNPLPARTPHHSADVQLSIGGRAGMLRLLVPSWMLAQAGAPE